MFLKNDKSCLKIINPTGYGKCGNAFLKKYFYGKNFNQYYFPHVKVKAVGVGFRMLSAGCDKSKLKKFNISKISQQIFLFYTSK